MQTDNFPTVSSIAEEVRSILADVRVSGGKLYSTEILLRPIQSAVRDAFGLLRVVGGARIMKTAYMKLPASQMVINPRSAGIKDLVAPVNLKQRTGITFLTVTTAAKSGKNLEITCGTHGQTGTVFVTLNDISGFPLANGLWTATVSGATTMTVLGCDVTGAWAVDASKVNQVAVGANQFSDMELSTSIQESVNYSGGSLTDTAPSLWSFDLNRIMTPPVNVDRQLQLRYYSSREVPEYVTDVVEVPDSLSFLATLSAANATMTRMPVVSSELRKLVWGFNGAERTAQGGLARQLVMAMLKAEANRRYSDNTRPGIGEGTMSYPHAY